MVPIASHSRLNKIRLIIFGLTALTAWLLGTGIWSPDPYRRLGFALDDWRQSQMQTTTADSRIALVDIDEHSLDAVGPWPWPRAVVAQLAQTLFTQYHAKAVGLDVMFPESGMPAGDEALLAVGRRYPLVFAQAFDLATGDEAPHVGHLGGALATRVDAPQTPVATGFIGNFFNDPDVCVGHVTPHADSDGVVRAIAPVIRYAGAAYPMLAWQLLHCRTNGRPVALSITALPVNARGLLHIPFVHSMRSFDVVPAVEVLTGTAPPALLSRRYVLVGSSALGLTDHIASPIAPWLPAVVVHAELLSDLLGDTAHHGFMPRLASLPILWTAVSILVFAALFRSQRASITLPVLIAATVVWLGLAVSMRAVPADLVALPLIPAAIFLLVQAPVEWISSQSAIRSFERRFSRYLPPTVLREIIRDRGLTAFKPERRQISVLFVDIEGYTRLAERMPPEQLAAATEVILTRLTRCVYDTAGTLDKYMGDALMAFWGAPLEQQDHADRALESASAMLREIDALNHDSELRSSTGPIHVRIGVNSGSAVVGELGSTSRQSYTAIGDTINVASRLQEYAKVADTYLLIGQETARLTSRHKLRAFSDVTLRGRVTPESLYVLDDGETDAVR